MPRGLNLFLSLLALLLPGTLRAASAVVIWPVDPSIGSTEKATALWIENRGAEPVTMQIRSLGWSQADGEDSYSPQAEVVASPPIADIAPGQRQLVRLIKAKAPSTGKEASYRLLIDELPKPAAAGAAAKPTAGLAIQMRYSIPLFVHGETLDRKTPASGLSASVRVIEGRRYLQIANRGAVHARLTDLGLRAAGRDFPITAGLAGYVLPGATMVWRLPEAAPLSGVYHVIVNGVAQTLSTSA